MNSKAQSILLKSAGFTLIELMIVIVLITIISIMAVPNIKNYGSSQKLKNAALQLQLDIRTAQNNATSGLKCGASEDKTALDWRVQFGPDTSLYQLLAHCIDNSSDSTYTKTLPGEVRVKQIDFLGETIQCTTSPTTGKIVTFSNISALVGFEGVPTNCNPKTMIITLQSASGSETLQVVIEKGGSVYVKE
jgi:prepilin-type N-terminal cleavage/methylation domain-containing protein